MAKITSKCRGPKATESTGVPGMEKTQRLSEEGNSEVREEIKDVGESRSSGDWGAPLSFLKLPG